MFLYMYVYGSLFLLYKTYYMPSTDLTALKLPPLIHLCWHKYKHIKIQVTIQQLRIIENNNSKIK